MRQFLLPDGYDGGPTCPIEGGPARYLLRVLRLAPGDGFIGLDREGLRRDCRVVGADADRLVVSVGPPRADSGESLEDTHGSRGRGQHKSGAETEGPAGLPSGRRIPLPRIVLVQGMAKGPAMDLVVRQAAETGVARIIPLLARRSVARPDEDRGSTKIGRWARIAREALQQSGSPVSTAIEEPATAAGLMERLGPPTGRRLCLLLHETPLAQESLHGYLGDAPEEIVLCVGPEGGLAPDEVELLSAAGFRPLLLPGAILRTETAALFAIASVETILSERTSWNPAR